MTTEFVVNHLWQSSCFVLLAGSLAFLLRHHSPKVRYWVWLSASLKFLIPFALLVSAGTVIPRPDRQTVPAAPVFTNTMVQVAEPFTPAPRAILPAETARQWAPAAIVVVWAIGFLAIALTRCRSWWRVQAALRAGTPVELPIPVRAIVTPDAQEPGIVGFLHPVLVLPAQLLEHLSPRQLDAVLAHELCHVRRRDNLFAAVHMIVEAIFWFHPLVWWIGSRMIAERELACDEEVLRTGCEPTDYAQGILTVCRLYTESPLACVAGVTGADVKKRIRAILAGAIAEELNGARKVALAAIALTALAAPVVIGVLTAPVIRAQVAPANTPKFEVASIRACPDPANAPAPDASPGRLVTGCAELLNLIGNAYNSYADGYFNRNSDEAPMRGGPSWLNSASYEIKANAAGNPSVPMMLGPMMQRLLEDRFQLKIHRETKEGPVYFLTVARGGAKLQAFKEGSCTPWDVPPPPLEPGTRYCANLIRVSLTPSIEALGTTLDQFAKTLPVDRRVINKTGISGLFDIRVKFSREGVSLGEPRIVSGSSSGAVRPRPPSDVTDTPSIFVALQEQLGLRLESGRGPVETLIIDHIERPSGN